MAKKTKNTDEPMDTVDYMEKFGDWVEKNSKAFVVVFALFVLGVGSYWAYSLYEDVQTSTVAEKSGIITRKVQLLEDAIKGAKNPDSEEFKTNLSKEISSIEKAALDLSADHPNHSSTDLALIKVAGFLDAQDQTDLAIKTLNSAKPSSKRLLSGVLVLLKAKIYHKSGSDSEALNAYDQVLENEGWKSFHAEALIQKALLNKKAGDFESAENALEKAKTLNDSGVFFEDAQKYLRLIKYEKSKTGKKASTNG